MLQKKMRKTLFTSFVLVNLFSIIIIEKKMKLTCKISNICLIASLAFGPTFSKHALIRKKISLSKLLF